MLSWIAHKLESLFNSVFLMAEDSQEKCTVSKEEGCILDSDERGIHPKLDMLLPRQRLSGIFEMISCSPIETKKIKDYIECNPDSINHIEKKGKDTVLHRFVRKIQEHDVESADEHKDFLKFLLDQNIDLTSKEINGDTPMHVAAKCNKYNTIRVLIQKGASLKNRILNQKNNEGDTCLHVAVKHCSVEVVAILHFHAEYLDETLTNKLEFTALDIAEKIKFNDDRLAMEKIIVILKSDRYEYIREKQYLEYLKETSLDEIWSLRPICNYYNRGGNMVVGNHNTVYIGDSQ